MIWNDAEYNYHHKKMPEYLKQAMLETGLSGNIRVEKVIKGTEELSLYRCICQDEGILLQGFYYEDFVKICSTPKEDIDLYEVIKEICEEWADNYRFMTDNRERLSKRESTEYLFPVLMDTKISGTLMDEIPHIERCGFPVGFHLWIPDGEDGARDILVSNQMQKQWGLETETLLEIAVHNPHFLNQCTVFSINDLMREMNQQADDEDWGGIFLLADEETDIKQYFVRGEMFPGAASILNKEFAEELYRKMGEDFLVVFGAEGEIQIHEKDSDVEDLQIEREMQNARFGLSKDWVSDEVFRYTKEHGLELACCIDEMEREVPKPVKPAFRR